MLRNKQLLVILTKMKILADNMSFYNKDTSKYLKDIIINWNHLNTNNKLEDERILNFRRSFNKGLNWIDMNRKDGEIWDEIYKLLNEMEKSPND